MSQVLGVVVIARNGDRVEYYQNPNNYGAAFTETTALGEVCQTPKFPLHFHSAYVPRYNLTNLAVFSVQNTSTGILPRISITCVPILWTTMRFMFA